MAPPASVDAAGISPNAAQTQIGASIGSARASNGEFGRGHRLGSFGEQRQSKRQLHEAHGDGDSQISPPDGEITETSPLPQPCRQNQHRAAEQDEKDDVPDDACRHLGLLP